MLGVVIIQSFPLFNKEKDFVMSTLNMGSWSSTVSYKIKTNLQIICPY